MNYGQRGERAVSVLLAHTRRPFQETSVQVEGSAGHGGFGRAAAKYSAAAVSPWMSNALTVRLVRGRSSSDVRTRPITAAVARTICCPTSRRERPGAGVT